MAWSAVVAVVWMLIGIAVLYHHATSGILSVEGWEECDYWPLIYLVLWPIPLLLPGPGEGYRSQWR